MSREIKFSYMWFNASGWIEKILTQSDLENGKFNEMFSSPELREYSLKCPRQYTGLNDRNGVEIYEGDITHHHNQEAFPHSQSEVRWHSNTAGFVCGSHFKHRRLNNPEAKCSVVIGNVYENPELLDSEVLAGGPGHAIG